MIGDKKEREIYGKRKGYTKREKEDCRLLERNTAKVTYQALEDHYLLSGYLRYDCSEFCVFLWLVAAV